MARLCHNQRKIASHFRKFTWLHFLAISGKAPPNSTPYSFRKKEVRSRRGGVGIDATSSVHFCTFTPNRTVFFAFANGTEWAGMIVSDLPVVLVVEDDQLIQQMILS